jgi:serralysin
MINERDFHDLNHRSDSEFSSPATASLSKLTLHLSAPGSLPHLLNEPAIKAHYSFHSGEARGADVSVSPILSHATPNYFVPTAVDQSAGVADVPAATPVGPSMDDEITFISGATGGGPGVSTVGGTTFSTWNSDEPASYNPTHSNTSKWGPEGPGPTTSTIGTAGGTQLYYFDPTSNWTPAEQTALSSGLKLWSAVANIQFAATTDESKASLVFHRATHVDTTQYPFSSGTFEFAPHGVGSTVGYTVEANQGPGAYIQVDLGDIVIGNFNSDNNGINGVTGFVHEEGHFLGFGHGGPYNGNVDPATDQYSAYDSDQYTIMSYLNPGETTNKYFSSNPNPGVNYLQPDGQTTSQATTWMPLDILAAQRLYGAPTTTPLSGGQTFGYHDNVGGGIGQYFDFSAITYPVATLFDTGTGNTLDLSGDHSAETIDLRPGDYSSFATLKDNLAIAYNTKIDTFIGGTAGTEVTVNGDNDTITDQGTGNQVDFSGVRADYVIATVSGVTTVTHGTVVDTLTGVQTVKFSDVSETLPCFLVGTRITTSRGAIAVEHLNVGDLALTQSGELRPIRWLGSRQLNCSSYREPSVIWPIRISSGAFGENLPVSDLWVSPGHSLLVDGVLIQASNLVNGATIVQVPRERVEYWHVELDSHDILMSEGLATESYLDTGNRTGFVNGGDFLEAHPDFGPKHWAQTCVPLVLEGPQVAQAREMLLARATKLGYVITDDAEVHIVADGAHIEPMQLSPTRLAFTLPANSLTIELCSRTFIPAHVQAASNDSRALGVCVSRIQLDGNDLALDAEGAFSEGWHQLEIYADYRQRWSQGRASLPSGTRLVVIDIASRSYCWVKPESAVVALFG